MGIIYSYVYLSIKCLLIIKELEREREREALVVLLMVVLLLLLLMVVGDGDGWGPLNKQVVSIDSVPRDLSLSIGGFSFSLMMLFLGERKVEREI